jgi:hypothetical protein
MPAPKIVRSKSIKLKTNLRAIINCLWESGRNQAMEANCLTAIGNLNTSITATTFA